MTQKAQPDYSKHKGTITINVYENCSTWQVTEGIPYHEIIGVLEICKTMYIHDISKGNRKAAIKQKHKPKFSDETANKESI